MNSMKLDLKHTFLFILLIPFFFSCMEQNGMSGTGVLRGKISIGPLCPVETVPPSPACSPTTETYKTWATAVWKLDKKTKVVTLNPTLDGNYRVVLPTGKYIIDSDGTQNYRAGSNLPTEISVIQNDSTTFNINIDTGIR